MACREKFHAVYREKSYCESLKGVDEVIDLPMMIKEVQ